MLTLFQIIILYSTIYQSLQLNCQQQTIQCSNHGHCAKQGICFCDRYFYGNECENEQNVNEKVEFVSIGINTTGLVLIILLWIFLFIIFYLIFEYLRIFYFNQDYQEKRKAMMNPKIVQVNFENQIYSQPLNEQKMALQVQSLKKDVVLEINKQSSSNSICDEGSQKPELPQQQNHEEKMALKVQSPKQDVALEIEKQSSSNQICDEEHQKPQLPQQQQDFQLEFSQAQQPIEIQVSENQQQQQYYLQNQNN